MLQVAGIGLNMTASRHASFLDKLFVPGLNQQAIDRLHRIGASETQAIQVREYLARGTVENRVNQILRTKKKVFGEIVETDPNWKKKLIQLLLEEEGL
jgi:SNF2 family DNA or RNA helicase